MYMLSRQGKTGDKADNKAAQMYYYRVCVEWCVGFMDEPPMVFHLV